MHRVLANIVVFSLWYWEFERGGAGKRALGERKYADVMFPQMTSPELADKDRVPLGTWSCLYLSSTNTAAFSPNSDVMPLKRWAKMIMMLRAGISLLLALMVVAWAVGWLRG